MLSNSKFIDTNLYDIIYIINSLFKRGDKMTYNILVVEDQKELRDMAKKYFEKEGYNCVCTSNGFEALDLFSKQQFHIAILDVMMPGIDGFEVLTEIRKISDIPVLMLTAKTLEKDRLHGFDLGADDYILKPFSYRELVSRVKVSLRRVYNYDTSETNSISYGELTLYIDSMELKKNGELINISTTEFEILNLFFSNIGVVFSRDQIIEKLFGYDYEGYDRSIDSHIKRIRNKIETDKKKPQYLRTKYGVGYVFGGKQ